MGNIFGRRKVYWVPANRRIADKIQRVSEWKNAEDFTGWQMQNDPKGLELILKFETCENLVEVNLSFNGLGDDECQAIARMLKGSMTLRRIDLSNNHIHTNGAQTLAEALTPRSGERDSSLEGNGLSFCCIHSHVALSEKMEV
jgi:Ran GTPase-activating protein (RanGAP) involved in mRNA processing and transport